MKYSLIAFCNLLLLGCFHSAIGQSSVYHPFPDSNAIWRESRFGGDGSFHHYEWEEEKFIKGDTIIGIQTYHKVYESGLFTQYLISTYDTSYYYYDNYIACFREDTNKRIFIYTNQEELLYDFNLVVGDTVPDGYNYDKSDGDTIIVSSIDSIYDGTGYRKRFILSDGAVQNYTSIIEGIGSTYGLFTMLRPPFESGGVLHCFIQNDSVKYNDGSFNACEIIDNINNNQTPEITIVPNPVQTITKFSIRDFSFPYRIDFYNQVGVKILTIDNIRSLEYIFDRKNLESGIYFYKIENHYSAFTGILILM